MTTMTKTHIDKLRNSDYLGGWDLIDNNGKCNDIIVTIKEVKNVMVFNQKTQKEEQELTVYFQECKPVILNSGNRKTLKKVTQTNFVEEMIGKQIQLTTKKIKAFGEWHDAIRVVDRIIYTPVQPVVTQPTKEDLNPLHEKWQQVINGIKSGKATIAYAQERFAINDENLELIKKLVIDEASI